MDYLVVNEYWLIIKSFNEQTASKWIHFSPEVTINKGKGCQIKNIKGWEIEGKKSSLCY